MIFTIRVPVKSDKPEWREKSSEIAFQEKVHEAKAQDMQSPHGLIYQPVQVTGEPVRGAVANPSRVTVFSKLGNDFLGESTPDGPSSSIKSVPVEAVVDDSATPEADDPPAPVSFETKSPHKPPPLQLEGDGYEDSPGFVTLVWAEPLKTRQAFNVQLAVMRAVARLHPLPAVPQ